MTDIVERLRDLALDYPDKPWISEAANEIERLREEQRATLQSVLYHFGPEGAHKVTTSALEALTGRETEPT
jgi:hypothetical protein